MKSDVERIHNFRWLPLGSKFEVAINETVGFLFDTLSFTIDLELSINKLAYVIIVFH